VFATQLVFLLLSPSRRARLEAAAVVQVAPVALLVGALQGPVPCEVALGVACTALGHWDMVICTLKV